MPDSSKPTSVSHHNTQHTLEHAGITHKASMWRHSRMPQRPRRSNVSFHPHSQVESSERHGSASLELLNYSVYKITVFGQLQGPSCSIIQLVHFGLHEWGVWPDCWQVCVCACVCVCSMYSTKQISAHKHQCHFFWIGLLTRQMQRQQTFQHTVCVQSVISSGFSYENIIALGFSYQKHSAWRFVRQRTLGIKQLTLCRSTHRRVWRRSCWRTPGCQHCNWGGRVSPSHSGWCYTAGQRTWRRCAPAPWSAWTVHLQERRCHTEQFSDQLTRATHQGEDLFSGWGGQCPTITHHRTHDRIRSF